MNTLMLALRNLLRNRRRSFATLLAMSIGLTAILVFGGYRSNIMYGSLTGFIQHTGHLQIQRKGYFLDGGDNPTAYGIDHYQDIIERIRHDPTLSPMLRVVTPTLQLGGIAGNFSAGVSRSVLATGLVPEEHNRMLTWNQYGMVSYSQLLPLEGRPSDSVVVGTGVARKLQLCDTLKPGTCDVGHDKVPKSGAEGANASAIANSKPANAAASASADASSGANSASASSVPDDVAALSALAAQDEAATVPPASNRIEMLAATSHGAPNVASLSVVQANNMGIKALDDVYMAMNLSQAQRLIYGSRSPQVTAIIVQLERFEQLPAAKQRLQALLRTEWRDLDLDILDFEQLNPTYGQTNQFMDSMFGFIATLIGVIVLFLIGNTMSTAVVERTAEIGTLRAMGVRRAGILRLFLSEAIILGVTGCVLGLLAATMVAAAINHSGWAWTPPGYSYAYLILVKVWQDQILLVKTLVGMFAVTVFSAWLPARRAARMEIVDALRHV